MEIGKKDVAWNFIATTMRVASGLIVLPLVLRLLPSEEVGLWNIFLVVGGLVSLLDFGFSNAFSRNITYIFSGVKELKAQGYVPVDNSDKSIDYSLLKSVISAMRRYYGILAIGFLVLFVVISPMYLSAILTKYSGDKNDVWFAWFTYGVLVAYQLYTFYYSSLLIGRGFIKKNYQIIIIGQASRILSSAIFLLFGFGLISLVIGQLVSDIVNRTLCYFAFYDKAIKHKIKEAIAIPVGEIMKIMSPNAVKIGFTMLGGFFISKAIIFVAPLYMALTDIASYGTTKQMIELTASLGGIWFNTYYPKITLHRVNENLIQLKRMYLKAKYIMFSLFIICGIGIIFIVPELLTFIHSKTHLLSSAMIAVFMFSAFLDANQGISASILLTKNEVPFMKTSILTGIGTFFLVFILLKFTDLGIWGLIIAPLLGQAAYQNWKWPAMVRKEFEIHFSDYFNWLPKNVNKK